MNITELKTPDGECPYCNGTGEADSGGIHPWGAPATIPCRCMYEDPFHVHVSAYNNIAAQLEDAQGEIRALRATEAGLRDRLSAIEAEHAALLKAISDAEPVAWLVCSVNKDKSLSLEHAAPWKEAAHEHINDAINEYGLEEAASWIVREVYTLNGIKK